MLKVYSSKTALQCLVLEKVLEMANIHKWSTYVSANICLCRISSLATAGYKFMQSGGAARLEIWYHMKRNCPGESFRPKAYFERDSDCVKP